MSGHNKWAQIKHKKSITDAKRGQLFSKLVKEIMVAVRVSGASPETNTRLRSALERAKGEGLPKENREHAIARAAGTEDGLSLHEFFYEATAPGGIMILIEGITDSKNRSTAEIKHLLLEHNAKLTDPGSLVWNFEKIGIIEVSKEKNLIIAGGEIENSIIDSGASDFAEIDSVFIIETEFRALDDVRKKLEALGIIVTNVAHDYKAKIPLELTEEEKKKQEALLDALLSHDDVQDIYTNF